MNGIKTINLKDKHKEILEDIKSNINEISNRINHYTHKYRGNKTNDINVNIQDLGNKLSLRIFLQNKNYYINHTLDIINNEIKNSNIIEHEK